MTPEEWGEAKAVLAEALELPADQRTTLLDLRCAGNPALRREVEVLLFASDDDGFLDAEPEIPSPGLAAGQVLGPYKVEKKLAEGGMGEVYQAFDGRLERRVAIKVLPARLSRDASALLRFERETKALAALSHPNILTIFDVGRSGDTAFAVTELLTGVTLRQRLERGKLPVSTAIEVAAQASRGLAAAHAEGIVHRDLKPENLFLTAGGPVKILDFGIATVTASRHGPASAPVRLTAKNAVIGTARYMSPEQARGESCDHRSDLFSLGAVLYELLSGSPAFPGDTLFAALHAVVELDPVSLGTLCPAASPQLVRLAHRCLEKEPDRRFQSASDLAFSLESLAEAPTAASGTGPPLPPAPAGRRRGLLRTLAVAALLLAAGATAGILAHQQWGRSQPPRLQRLTFGRGYVTAARFAPDGQTIVYSAGWDGGPFEIFTTRTDSPESRPLGLPSALLNSISPRGEMLIDLLRKKDGVLTGFTLARAPLGGGAPRPILEGLRRHSADWAPDGETFALAGADERGYWIEYPHGHVLWRSADEGWGVKVSPQGDAVAFCELHSPHQAIVVLDRAGKVVARSDGWRLLPAQIGSAECVSWAPGGKEVWFAAARPEGEGGLYALSRSGQVRPLLFVPGSLALLDIARDGRVLFAHIDRRKSITARAPGEATERDLSWFDSSNPVDLSFDGRQVLFTAGGQGGGPPAGVYLRGTDGSPAIRLGDGVALALSPDGRWALARSATDGRRLFLLPTGAGEPRSLPDLAVGVAGASWLPDGKRLVLDAIEPGKGARLYLLGLGAKKARALTPAGFWTWATSPDGSRLAAFDFADVRSGVRIYPTAGGAPSTLPGGSPLGWIPVQWTADGRALYLGPSGLAEGVFAIDEVEVATGKRVPWKVLRLTDPAGANIRGVWMTRDGEAYAYGATRSLSTLYLAEGLR